MPKVAARDLAWLARPSPGFQLFRSDSDEKDDGIDGPARKIAHRGTEIFVAVGREIRWSELGRLKDAGDEFVRKHGQYGSGDASLKAYRVRR